MADILIVEDEQAIRDLLRMSLTGAGYRCTCACDGTQAADLLEGVRFDLVLLDVMLPGIDGFALMPCIRALEIPVIFLTAVGAVSERVKGLKMGAEDYIVKPFAVLELLARVEGVLRRHNKLETSIEIGGLCIDTGAMRVRRGDAELALTHKEYELLLLFARNPNVVLYKDAIYERVWGGEYPDRTRTVELHIQRMKKKVGWDACLKSVYALGYRLEV